MCHIVLILTGCLVMYMAYYMVTIRERADAIEGLLSVTNNKTEE